MTGCVTAGAGSGLKAGLLAATIFMVPAVGRAQDADQGAARPNQLEEVVVTARRQAENLQSTPVAVTALRQETFERAGVFETTRLNQVAPGMHVSVKGGDANRSSITFSIRGQSYTYGTLFPAVIPYFAEVPIVSNFSNGNFFDLDNVQILRGPQGVQFGRVTDGGNVLIEPAHPTNLFEGYVQGQVGDYGMYGLEAALNVPVVKDKVLLRVAGQMQRRDGFTTNIFNGRKLDDVDFQTWRIGLTLRPTEQLENYTVVQYNQSNDNSTSTKLTGVNSAAVLNTVTGLFTGLGFAYTGLLGPGVPLTPQNFLTALQSQLALQNALGPRKTNLSMPLFNKRHNFYAVNKTTFELNDNFSIKNILGYARTMSREATDVDGSTVPYIDTTHAYLPFFSQEQLSEEFQVHGKAFDSRLNYTAGVYLDYQHPAEAAENYTINLAILQRDTVAINTTRSKAAYAQAEYDLGDLVKGLKINGGIRRTHDTFRSANVTYLALTPNPFIPEAPIPHGVCTSYRSNALGPQTCTHLFQRFNATTYSFGASMQFTPDHFGYIKYGRGYRPGGSNTTAPNPALIPYKPEFDKSLEIGVKSDWALGAGVKARMNIALFSDDYTDIQKINSVIGTGGVPASITTNAAKAKIQGVEFEGTLLPLPGLSLGVQYAYTEARFLNPGDVPEAVLFGDARTTPTTGAGACNPKAFVTSGFCYLNRLNSTPKNAVTFDAHYTLPTDDRIGTVTIGGSVYHQSSMALSDTSVLNPSVVAPGYTTLDLDAAWERVGGSPVTLRAFVTNLTNKVHRVGGVDLDHNGSVGTDASIYAPPRMFGVSLRYAFGGG